MTAFPSDTALLVIDLQPDFMPGGALACAEGDAIVAPIATLLAARRYATVVATQDWHPPTHASFASQHPGRQPFEQFTLHGHPQTLWPDHCVQGTPGAALHPAVDWDRADLILRKGTREQVDSYSALRENYGPAGDRPPTGLAGWLRRARHRRGACLRPGTRLLRAVERAGRRRGRLARALPVGADAAGGRGQ